MKRETREEKKWEERRYSRGRRTLWIARIQRFASTLKLFHLFFIYSHVCCFLLCFQSLWKHFFFRITFSTPLTVRYILTAGAAFLLLMSFSTFSISIYQAIIFNCMFIFIWLIPWLLLHLLIFLGLMIFYFKLFWIKSIHLLQKNNWKYNDVFFYFNDFLKFLRQSAHFNQNLPTSILNVPIEMRCLPCK